ncbi:MAG: hypothetical protein ACLFP1_04205 [Candidatus Goldiibacteriota bacterium]
MNKLYFYTACFFAAVLITGCASAKIRLDKEALNEFSEIIVENPENGGPDKLKKLINDPDVISGIKAYEDAEIKAEPLNKWPVKMPDGADAASEKLSFKSGLRKSDGSRDTAVFYHYKSPLPGAEKAVLWVPGFSVSDFSFRFMKKSFESALARGYDIFFYVIPFHLERTEPGRVPGEGLLYASAEGNIKITRQAVREIRTITRYIRREGIKKTGARCSSVGAAYVFLASCLEKFDHICFKIPMVDWEPLLENSTINGIIEIRKENGFNEELIKSAYELISPINHSSLTPPERMLIQYGEYDRFFPPGKITEFAEKQGIENIKAYKESHSTIRLNDKVNEDYAAFLDSLK